MNNLDGVKSLNKPPSSQILSLGWRLALLVTLILSVVMGVISINQQRVNANYEQDIQYKLLQMSLIPLAKTIEEASTWNKIEYAVLNYHKLFTTKGYASHDLFLQDTKGETIITTDESSTIPILSTEPKGHFSADMNITSELFEGGKGRLIVHDNPTGYSAMINQRRLLWFTHFIITVGVVSFFLVFILYYQVTRPVNKLVRAVKKMEQGYWGAFERGSGAWEIQWLNWRFFSMATELKNTMKHLFEAEQKTRNIINSRNMIISNEPELNSICEDNIKDEKTDPSQSPEYHELQQVCEQIEEFSIVDDKSLKLIKDVSEKQIPLANRLGFYLLKARMENAKLRLTQPEPYQQLDKLLENYKTKWHDWLQEQREAMQDHLEKQGIPCAKILHRTKHTAGVWAKMNGKDLDMEEVYDLFAFRIIVPTETDCYIALGFIHDTYIPDVTRFKDYISEPKENGYQSIHTCVKSKNGPIFEVQIRSITMDLQAERGNAAHWLYKDDKYTGTSQNISWWHSISNFWNNIY